MRRSLEVPRELTVTIGRHRDMKGYTESFKTCRVHTVETVTNLLPGIPLARASREVPLRIVTGRELNIREFEQSSTVFARAEERKQRLLLPEAALALAEQWTDMPAGLKIVCATEPLKPYAVPYSGDEPLGSMSDRFLLEISGISTGRFLGAKGTLLHRSFNFVFMSDV